MFLTISSSDTRRMAENPSGPFSSIQTSSGVKRVNEIGLMGGYEYLRCVPSPGGMGTELPRQRLQKLVIKAVLRLLDTDERRRIGVFQQQQISKHLERAVGHLLREKWILKTGVVEPQQNPLVFGDMGIDTCDTRYPVGDTRQDGVKTILVFPLHELHDIAQVVAMHIQMPLRAGDRQAARGIRRESTRDTSPSGSPETG